MFKKIAIVVFCSINVALTVAAETPEQAMQEGPATSISHHALKPSNSGKPHADWLLTGGKFYTVDDEQPWAQAVAIAKDMIIYVGDESGATKFVSKDTRVTDLGGRFVIPGIVDSHTHPGLMGIEQEAQLDVNSNALGEAKKEDIPKAIKDYADSNPELEWIRMCCFSDSSYGKAGPNKRDLDAVVPDRPVWITGDSAHSAWVNSKALKILGVDRNTPDPAPGVSLYARDKDGRLTGYLKELYWKYGEGVFSIDRKVHEQGMMDFLDYMSQHGVTTLYDAGNESYDDRVYTFISKLDKEGRLPIRYEGTDEIFIPQHKESAIARLRRLQRTHSGNRLHFNTIKLYMDGTNETRTAALLEPYVDDPENSGKTTVTAAELRDFLLELDEVKIDLHIHVIGDRGVRTILDAVEAARKAVDGELYPRVTIAHLQLIDPTDFPRIKALGVIANYTPHWHVSNPDVSTKNALGEERNARIFSVKPLFDLGAVVTFSNDDWSFESMSPFLGIQVGHNRQFPKEWVPFYLRPVVWLMGMNDPHGPESERLDIELMIRGYTINGAYQLRMEDQIGSLEVGKLADLVVLDDNLFEMDRYKIHKVKPSAVIMEGKLIHGSVP